MSDNGGYDKSNLSLFSNENRQGSGDKQPLMRGYLDLNAAEIKWVIEQRKQGKPGRLRVVVWRRAAKSTGKPFLSGLVEPDIPRPPRKQDFSDFDPLAGVDDDMVL